MNYPLPGNLSAFRKQFKPLAPLVKSLHHSVSGSISSLVPASSPMLFLHLDKVHFHSTSSTSFILFYHPGL